MQMLEADGPHFFKWPSSPHACPCSAFAHPAGTWGSSEFRAYCLGHRAAETLGVIVSYMLRASGSPLLSFCLGPFSGTWLGKNVKKSCFHFLHAFALLSYWKWVFRTCCLPMVHGDTQLSTDAITSTWWQLCATPTVT